MRIKFTENGFEEVSKKFVKNPFKSVTVKLPIDFEYCNGDKLVIIVNKPDFTSTKYEIELTEEK